MARPSLSALLAPGAKARNLDLNALLAIAQHEGASGGIGDSGHAFGPFQLNNAGGVLTGKFAGQTPEQINRWAWSPAGIDYALSGIGKVAAGQRGEQAVRSIASKFERPADIPGEIRDALAHYGKTGVTPAPQMSAGALPLPPSSGTAQPAGTPSLLASLLTSTNQLVGLGPNPTLAALLGPLNAAWGDHPGTGATVGGKPGQGQGGLPPLKPAAHGGLAELLNEGVGGPTHSTGAHVHAAFTDPRLELAAINRARQLGLHIGENPYAGDAVDPVHAPNSYHTRTFPGLYNGRRLGQAIDVSGGNTKPFYAWLAAHRA